MEFDLKKDNISRKVYLKKEKSKCKCIKSSILKHDIIITILNVILM